ncbi:hypothetical protein D3C72_2138880 [compost metagenome]
MAQRDLPVVAREDVQAQQRNGIRDHHGRLEQLVAARHEGDADGQHDQQADPHERRARGLGGGACIARPGERCHGGRQGGGLGRVHAIRPG